MATNSDRQQAALLREGGRSTEEERETIIEMLVANAGDAINDSDKFSQRESRDMWRYLASEATNWARTIASEMEGNDDDG